MGSSHYLIEKVIKVKDVSEIFIVTNGKFYQNFLEYITSKRFSKPVKLINDGTFTNDSRLGGIGNLWLAIEQENINEDILVILGLKKPNQSKMYKLQTTPKSPKYLNNVEFC